MKIATIVVRVLLGLMFIIFGLNSFLHFIPMQQPDGPGKTFITVMAQTGYLHAMACFQIAGGLLLVIGSFVPLGLTLLGPVIVNILFFHLFMDHSGLPLALIVSALSLFLLWRYRSHFAGLVKA